MLTPKLDQKTFFDSFATVVTYMEAAREYKPAPFSLDNEKFDFDEFKRCADIVIYQKIVDIDDTVKNTTSSGLRCFKEWFDQTFIPSLGKINKEGQEGLDKASSTLKKLEDFYANLCDFIVNLGDAKAIVKIKNTPWVWISYYQGILNNVNFRMKPNKPDSHEYMSENEIFKVVIKYILEKSDVFQENQNHSCKEIIAVDIWQEKMEYIFDNLKVFPVILQQKFGGDLQSFATFFIEKSLDEVKLFVDASVVRPNELDELVKPKNEITINKLNNENHQSTKPLAFLNNENKLPTSTNTNHEDGSNQKVTLLELK